MARMRPLQTPSGRWQASSIHAPGKNIFQKLKRKSAAIKRLPATSDLAIKKVLASEDNKDILCGLILDFFEVMAEDLTIINPYSIDVFKEYATDGADIGVLRQILRDIAATFRIADFIAEVQVRKILSCTIR